MKEGSLERPTRYPINFKNPDFLDKKKLDDEMRRVFEVCHSCRRCYNLCDSFPTLFDLIDESNLGEVESVKSSDFGKIVDRCTLCDICYMAKCPYVPPHEFNIDFPHLMLRYRSFQRKNHSQGFAINQLIKIDRNAKFFRFFAPVMNWITDVKHKIEFFTGIDRRAELPKFNYKTFTHISKSISDSIQTNITPSKRKVVIYSSCYVENNNISTGTATIQVLKKNNVDFVVTHPECCGMPNFEQSDLEVVEIKSKRIANFFKSYIDEGYKIVTLTASCSLMLKSEWPLINPNNENVKKLSKNVMDINELIVDIANNEGLADGLQSIPGGISFHHACHARAQNMGAKGLELLKLIPNSNPVIIESCSGHGGTFGIMKKTHDFAIKVGKKPVREVLKFKNKYIASDCPLAAKHLKQKSEDNDNKFLTESKHPIEILAISYGFNQ